MSIQESGPNRYGYQILHLGNIFSKHNLPTPFRIFLAFGLSMLWSWTIFAFFFGILFVFLDPAGIILSLFSIAVGIGLLCALTEIIPRYDEGKYYGTNGAGRKGTFVALVVLLLLQGPAYVAISLIAGHLPASGASLVQLLLIPAFVVVVSGKLGTRCSRMYSLALQQMSVPAPMVVNRDRRQPIVFLRSFSNDDSIVEHSRLQLSAPYLLFPGFLNPAVWLRERRPRIEEVICLGLTRVGPVVAIGQPGEELPRLGAARSYVEEVEWKKAIAEQIDVCRFACLLVGNSDGLKWELEQVLEKQDNTRLLLCLPQDVNIEKLWHEFTLQLPSTGKFRFPTQIPENTLAVLFCCNGDPIVVTGDPVVASYREIAVEMTRFDVCESS